MNHKEPLALLFQWTARLSSMLALTFLVFMLMSHISGTETWSFNNPSEIVMFCFFPVMTMIGLVLGWPLPGWGGAITVLSFSGLILLRPHLITATPILSLGVPGILFLLQWAVSRPSKLQTT